MTTTRYCWFCREKKCVKINEIFVLRYLNLKKVKERRRIYNWQSLDDFLIRRVQFIKIFPQNLLNSFDFYRLPFDLIWICHFPISAQLGSLSYWNERQRRKNKQNQQLRKQNKTNWICVFEVCKFILKFQFRLQSTCVCLFSEKEASWLIQQQVMLHYSLNSRQWRWIFEQQQ